MCHIHVLNNNLLFMLFALNLSSTGSSQYFLVEISSNWDRREHLDHSSHAVIIWPTTTVTIKQIAQSQINYRWIQNRTEVELRADELCQGHFIYIYLPVSHRVMAETSIEKSLNADAHASMDCKSARRRCK